MGELRRLSGTVSSCVGTRDGLLDNLSYSMHRQAAAEVPAGGTYSWYLEISWIDEQKKEVMSS